MALRVLLADNSESIRRVIQLSLQDFGVDVKSIGLGVDILDVARTYKPDVIFVDILLQKRDGYAVAESIKMDAELKSSPVVLMWSGFMDFDEGKARQTRAEGRLEKPFDSETLRSLVMGLVPRLKLHPLTGHLIPPRISKPPVETESAQAIDRVQIPEMPSAPVVPPPVIPVPVVPANIPTSTMAKTAPDDDPSWKMDDFEDIKTFMDLSDAEHTQGGGIIGHLDGQPNLESDPDNLPELELEVSKPPRSEEFSARQPEFIPPDFILPELVSKDPEPTAKPDAPSGDEYSRIPLGPISAESTIIRRPPIESPQHFSEDLVIGEVGDGTAIDDNEWRRRELKEFQMNLPQGASTDQIEVEVPSVDLELDLPVAPVAPMATAAGVNKSAALNNSDPQLPQLEPHQIEEFLRRQSHEIIREIALRVVPEIATDLINKEIQRLLEESNQKSPR